MANTLALRLMRLNGPFDGRPLRSGLKRARQRPCRAPGFLPKNALITKRSSFASALSRHVDSPRPTMMLVAMLFFLLASTVSALHLHRFSHAHHRPIERRQSQTTKPDPASYYTLSTLSTGDTQCLFPLAGVDGSVPFPVRFAPCRESGPDDQLWQFVPDGGGLYFVYNKAIGPGTSKRLDIHCQKPTLCIMWMGPSGEEYNNQRWALVRSIQPPHKGNSNMGRV